MSKEVQTTLLELQRRLDLTQDQQRPKVLAKRHAKGYRTARENLYDLVDQDSFLEYGQLAVAAQRGRRDYDSLKIETPADGILTGTATINAEILGSTATKAAVVINDYSVLAGTQGFFHHKKLDRICQLAEKQNLPMVMYTEGGDGRPGDTDVTTQVAGLNIKSFAYWARLSGKVLRIAVNNGYCFAGNAALFGCADITIATKSSWIGMAGPAMIEGGGLGSFAPTEIGPIEVQERNGVVDIVAEDEAHATALAQQLLGYFQGSLQEWQSHEQTPLVDIIPADRRWAYQVRKVISTLADVDSFIELRKKFGRSIITGFMRLKGKPIALIANDCQQLGACPRIGIVTRESWFEADFSLI